MPSPPPREILTDRDLGITGHQQVSRRLRASLPTSTPSSRPRLRLVLARMICRLILLVDVIPLLQITMCVPSSFHFRSSSDHVCPQAIIYINDYPQKARWKVTNKETMVQVRHHLLPSRAYANKSSYSWSRVRERPLRTRERTTSQAKNLVPRTCPSCISSSSRTRSSEFVPCLS